MTLSPVTANTREKPGIEKEQPPVSKVIAGGAAQNWATLLRDLQARRFRAPTLTVADGHFGIRGALAGVWPESAERRCRNHELQDVLDVVPE